MLVVLLTVSPYLPLLSFVALLAELCNMQTVGSTARFKCSCEIWNAMAELCPSFPQHC